MSSPTDFTLIANQLPISQEFPKDQDRFLETLTLWEKRVANAVNSKEGGLYSLQEIFSFKQYFTLNNPGVFRNVYRKCFDMVDLNAGPIAGGATVAFPHGIVGLFESGDIKADCTSATPTYFSVMGQPTVYLDAVNVNFTNPLPATALTKVVVIAEYLKN
jgi:hypothetical protein